MTSFDLRALVVQTINDLDDPDPGVIAEKVLSSIPRQHLEYALRQTLRGYVRNVMTSPTTRLGPAAPSAPPEDRQKRRVVSSRSAKRQNIKEAFEQRLRDPIHVGDSCWKYLQDCTHADLVFAAEERRQKASQNLHWAAKFDERAKAVKDHGVATFGDLPRDVQRQLLSDEGEAAA